MERHYLRGAPAVAQLTRTSALLQRRFPHRPREFRRERSSWCPSTDRTAPRLANEQDLSLRGTPRMDPKVTAQDQRYAGNVDAHVGTEPRSGARCLAGFHERPGRGPAVSSPRTRTSTRVQAVDNLARLRGAEPVVTDGWFRIRLRVYELGGKRPHLRCAPGLAPAPDLSSRHSPAPAGIHQSEAESGPTHEHQSATGSGFTKRQSRAEFVIQDGPSVDLKPFEELVRRAGLEASNKAATGTRVPLNTHAPLTRSGCRRAGFPVCHLVTSCSDLERVVPSNPATVAPLRHEGSASGPRENDSASKWATASARVKRDLAYTYLETIDIPRTPGRHSRGRWSSTSYRG